MAVWRKAVYWVGGLWPIALGVFIYLAGKKTSRMLPGSWQIPPGDIHILLSNVLSHAIGYLVPALFRIRAGCGILVEAGLERLRLAAIQIAESTSMAESRLSVWKIGGAVLVATGALLFGLALQG
jgi:hypothetical protein